jgi:hypothetical protein
MIAENFILELRFRVLQLRVKICKGDNKTLGKLVKNSWNDPILTCVFPLIKTLLLYRA